MIHEINTDIKHLHTSIQLSDSAKEQIAVLGYDPKYGARPLRRAIQKNIENKIAEMLLKHEILNDKIVFVDFVNNEFAFTLADNQK